MKVSLIEPSNLSHRVRGTGFYTSNLKLAFQKYLSSEIEFVSPGKADIVHYPFFEPFFLSLPLKKNKKTVVTVHDLTPLVFPKEFPSGLKGKLKWQLQKKALKNADAIITDSKNSQTDILKFVGVSKDKVQVIYLAPGEEFKQLNNEIIKQSVKKKFGLPDKFILYVGDVTWNKNLPRLIEATKKINIPLVMVGKALTEKYFDRNNPWNQDLIKVQEFIAQQSNNRAIEKFINLGFVDKEDLVSLYNLAALFVMPSLYEGFGLPILEAMACGCPVVTTKEGSIPEITGESVYYVDAYGVSSIANGIGEVYFNPDLAKKLSEKGLKQAKKFSWEKTAEETFRVYKNVFKNS